MDVIGQAAQLGECLASLHRRGLAEQRRDRFGLPICKAENYRKMLLGDLQLGASVVGLSNWLAARNPAASESQSAVGAALAIIDFAAEREDWMTVVQLARVAEQILFITARWQAWHHVLSQGLTAAKAAHASTIEAYFSHQLGSLELCLDHLDEASRLLRHALTLREQDGDTDGADLTRHNLQLVEPPPPPPPPPRPRRPHAVVVALTVVLTVLGLIAGAVAFASTNGGGGPSPSPSPSPSISSPHSTSSPPGNQVAVPDVTGRTQAQATSALEAAGLTAAPTTTTNCGTADNGNVVTQDPAGGTSVAKGTSVTIGVCSAAPATVTVPNVTGQTQAQATSALEAAGLTAAPTTTTNCTTADNGNVVTQDPAGGTSVAKGTSVTIGVCSAAPRLTVPNVIGESQAAAIDTLQAQGLTQATATSGNCDPAESGTVVTEDPTGGTAVAQGSSVSDRHLQRHREPNPIPVA